MKFEENYMNRISGGMIGLQLHWNKLEWVDTKSLIKRGKPYSVSSKYII